MTNRTASDRNSPVKHIDGVLLGATFGLMAVGGLLVYLATSQKLAARGFSPTYYLKRDVLYMVVGSVFLLIMAAIDYRSWKGFIPVVYGLTVLALLAVLSPIGSEGFGASSWFALPGFDVEPDELAKLAIIIVPA